MAVSHAVRLVPSRDLCGTTPEQFAELMVRLAPLMEERKRRGGGAARRPWGPASGGGTADPHPGRLGGVSGRAGGGDGADRRHRGAPLVALSVGGAEGGLVGEEQGPCGQSHRGL